ncbi:somatostatin receptor type 4 [Nematostella vectensis]|uniref:somatostatin receptor type 4 n=1 Tax=Nematostella vectensis TaxID=45351 RepID=UPI0020778B47|nr:somatostatin receptor type 4 [Nematostella vectensis]
MSIARLFMATALVRFCIALFGVTGNCAVIFVVWSTRSMHTTTNYLLVNLALADVITLLMDPFLHTTLFEVVANFGTNAWTQTTKDWLCRVFIGAGLLGVFVLVSVLLLTIVAVERYHALLKPMNTRLRLEKEHVWKVVLCVWLFALLLNIPLFEDTHFDVNANMCTSALVFNSGQGMATYLGIYFSVSIIIPSIIITICYLSILKGLFITKSICSETVPTDTNRESKKKLAKLLASVTIAFYICVLPFAVFNIYMAADQQPKGESLFRADNLMAFIITASLSMVNSCLNPVLYAFQSSSYKRGFVRFFTCRCCISSMEHNISGLNTFQVTNTGSVVQPENQIYVCELTETRE